MQARVDLLLRAADLIRQRQFTFCAWLTYEVGKNWAEADADVGECIDFLEFYAREALRLDAATTPIQFPGERNFLRYIPLGVGAVIPPWNFPFAIMAGMTAAAIVTGNTVILKPSVDAPTVAAIFFALLEEAGMPDGVVNFCPGEGPGFGAAVVAHPQTRFIAFTGSKKVGLEIHESAAKTQPGQRFIKRTILEMGGKDAIIVDADCRPRLRRRRRRRLRLRLQRPEVQRLLPRHRRRRDLRRPSSTASPSASKPSSRATPPRTSTPARSSAPLPTSACSTTSRSASPKARLLLGGEAVSTSMAATTSRPPSSSTSPPTPASRSKRSSDPCSRSSSPTSFDDALEIANNTEYGLTGAIYSATPSRLDRARNEFHVGNLYLNRKCTGAMVGAHPFGGFNMSGTDSKAGGPDYLLLFTQGKSIAEKVAHVSKQADEEEALMGL